MFSRPIILPLLGTVSGVLTGNIFPASINSPFYLLPLATLFFSGLTLFSPLKLRKPSIIAVFFLLGINSQVNKPVVSRLPDNYKEKDIVIQGTIYGPPRLKPWSAAFPVRAEMIHSNNKSRKVKINILVKIYGYKGDLKTGDRIRFPARIKAFENFDNPGGFNYRSYMQNQGFSFKASVSDSRYLVPMGRGDPGLMLNILERVRGPLRQFFSENLSRQSASIFTALILGERQLLARGTRESFARAGVSHIMAVSGLHLGLVAWMVFMFTRRLLSFSSRLTLAFDIKKVSALVSVFPVLAYGFITGFHVSSQRAAIMVLVFLFSFLIDRERDIWSSLLFSALIILVLNGNALFTASFQLSFAAVCGILWLAPLIISRVPAYKPAEELSGPWRILHRGQKYSLGLLAVSTAASIITIPLIAHHFHRISIVALPANLMVVPLIGLWVLPLGLLSSFVYFFSLSLARLLLFVEEAGLNLVLFLVEFWSHIPWASVWVFSPNWFEIILVYGLFFVCIHFYRSRIFFLLLPFFMAIVFIDCGYWYYRNHIDRNLRLTVLDVGIGNPVFVRFPGGENMLIAGRDFCRRGPYLSRVVIAPYLWHEKIRRIDYFLLTVSEKKCAKGLQFLIDNFGHGKILCNETETSLIKGVFMRRANDRAVTFLYKGRTIRFETNHIRIEGKFPEKGKREIDPIVITGKGPECPPPAINTAQTGALTVKIDMEGRIGIKSYLKKGLPENGKAFF